MKNIRAILFCNLSSFENKQITLCTFEAARVMYMFLSLGSALHGSIVAI